MTTAMGPFFVQTNYAGDRSQRFLVVDGDGQPIAAFATWTEARAECDRLNAIPFGEQS